MQHVNCYLWGDEGLVILPDVRFLTVNFAGPWPSTDLEPRSPRRYVTGPRKWTARIAPDRVHGVLTERSIAAGPYPALLTSYDRDSGRSWEMRASGYVTGLETTRFGGPIREVCLELREDDQPI